MRKVVLVTGASAGIGTACAVGAAKAGYDVAVAYGRDSDGAEATARAVREAGGRAEIVQADMATPEGPDVLFQGFDAAFDRLDALINNAGIVDVAARVEDMSQERLSRMFQINVVAPMRVAGLAVKRMSTKHGGAGGVIVNLSSVAARLGSANQFVDYAASKGAIDSFNKGLADEVAGEGIRVAAVRPGLIDTAIHAKGGDPDRAQRLAHMIPMGRTGSAAEVAATVLWLMSDAASYVTGTTLDVSGGR
ncbi:glucose-1-dehydrogenase [Defluviimonas sp. 20V17]|uniref:Glucose 1-dehydrogenase n=1 Tax=Allgaiera indica TaxID=765699 RepID=A0AAN4ZYM7_9RHOB|nr:SDR family oxidoreductase [Allgaiera indica]KDB03798.1 glucose-1-dehydrogenase [Defluviimonas sp. 20V17]GHE00014.1 glucose-1-dehydrogenase [Allgaiera indica]SDW38771.1 glucose 1-dehydrogenase [Allgaiera indica]